MKCNTFILKCFIQFTSTNVDGSQKERGNFFNLLQKEGVPRHRSIVYIALFQTIFFEIFSRSLWVLFGMFLAKSMKFKWGLTFYMIQKHLQSFLTLHLLHPWGCAPYTKQFVIICKAKTFHMGFFLLGEEGVRQKGILPILETLPRNTGTCQDLGNHTR